MSNRRTKTPALDAPGTKQEAIQLIAEFADADAEIASIDAETSAKVSAIKAEADQAKAPLKDRIADLRKRLSIWWAVAKREVAGDKRRSVELAGCAIGERVGNPAVKVKRGLDEAALAAELATVDGCAGLVRQVWELDRQAILRAFGSPQADDVERTAVCLRLGINVEQRDDFFVQRLAPSKDGEPAADDRRAA